MDHKVKEHKEKKKHKKHKSEKRSKYDGKFNFFKSNKFFNKF